LRIPAVRTPGPQKPSALADLIALGIRPRKGLGQNFLVDPAHRSRIVAAAGLAPADSVLEIGPGLGVLTELLAEQAGRVVAVELDDRLIPYLRQRFANQPHVQIVHGDILKLDPAQVIAEANGMDAPLHYKVVANLPYYITGAAIPHLLEAKPAPDVTVLTLQREVAERMTAGPPDMSLLALGTQYYAEPFIVARIPAGAFYPVPKVDSAVVRLVWRLHPSVWDVPAGEFFRLARAGFSQKRKQLRNSLAAGLGIAPGEADARLRAAGILPQRRAETLTLDEWAALARAMRVEDNREESGKESTPRGYRAA
jgi:16S rRNA (adenine1518-N6/adenine1519-N6)-dimethyltransferase